mmetsp:Transcript_28811/g.46592  ORF Transcript_28811/g.46592 Transcript_28811/m.46592 type:complete len:151 (+) Transcript_28811:172-624(+)
MSQQTYTKEDVSAHNTEADCWIIIHGNVYDVSRYAMSHPGGHSIIVAEAGRDATDKFDNVRHSSSANGRLRTLLIGKLADASVSSKPAPSSIRKPESVSAPENKLTNHLERRGKPSRSPRRTSPGHRIYPSRDHFHDEPTNSSICDCSIS